MEDVIASLPTEEIGRLVTVADECDPDRWRALVNEVGIEQAREPLLAGVVTAAVEELVPPPRWLVAMREGTSHGAPGPIDVLATLLTPQSVWSSGECRAAYAGYAGCPLREGLSAVQAFAQSETTEWHLDRARYVAHPVARVLPLSEAPRTTSQIEEALKLVQKRGGAATLCNRLLLGAVARLDGLVTVAPSPN